MNASKAARHKIFHGKPSFVDKKMYPKSRFCELTTDEIQEIMDKAVPETTKEATKFGMRLFNGTYLLSSLKICKISNVTVEILHICEDYIIITFTLMLPNGLLVLVAPHFQIRSNTRNVETRVECLFEVFLHVCQKERWHVLEKFIHKIY